MISLPWKIPPEVKTLEVNGYAMAYLEQGQGAPLVLVHGSLNDYRTWASQVVCFSASFRTIAVSLRHCYPEPWDGAGEDFSVGQHADDLAIFIKDLKAGPVHLVGHSRGGDVALVMAAKDPQQIRSLVLADPAPLNDMLPETPEVSAAAQNRKAFVTDALARIQQGDVDEGLEIFLDAVSRQGSWKRLPELVKQMRRDNAWALKSLVADGQVPFNCSDAGLIDSPVLLVTGEQSPSLYGMMHSALKPCLRNHQNVIIPNASHGMYADNPEAFNDAVLKFLLQCDPP